MKKICLIFAICLMFFALSCGSSGNSGKKDNTDTGETVTDEDTADSGHDTTPEQPDDEDSGRKQGELYGECYPNATCNKGLICDEENNICIKDPDSDDDTDSDASDSTPDEGDTTPDDADSADDSDTFDPTDDADSADDSDPADSQSDEDTDSGEPEEHCETVDAKLWWSSKTTDSMNWESAIEHCKKLKESNACGYSDWHLPTIDELKTLLKWRRDSQCKISETNNKLSLSDWTCSSCSEGCTEGANGECNCSYTYYFEDGRYSELGDVGWLWSSSVVSGDYSYLAWGVNFYYAKVYYEGKSTYKNVYVRCVR